MALSPADFYAFSSATGIDVPDDPYERAALAPQVLEFRRNQLKAPQQEPNVAQTIGAAALAYQFLFYPLLGWGWKWLQAMSYVPAEMSPPPLLDAEQLWVMLSGILGIAGMRTFEKQEGVASK